MAKKTKQKRSSICNNLGLLLLVLALVLTLLQFVFKTYFGIDLGITFFGQEMF